MPRLHRLVASALPGAFAFVTILSSAAAQDEIVLDRALVIARHATPGRIPFAADPIGGRVTLGTWSAPKAGDAWIGGDGKESTWREVAAAKGAIEDDALRDGMVFWRVESPAARTLILEASGHSGVLVNGEPRAGDPYSTGYVLLPVALKAGVNEFLFTCARGRVAAKLAKPAAELMLNLRDATLPDAVAGAALDGLGAVIVMNATDRAAENVVLRAKCGAAMTETPVGAIPAHGVRKAPFSFTSPASPEGEVALEISAACAGFACEAPSKINIRVRPPHADRKVTFRSGVDGSVQYYGFVPAAGDGAEKPGVVLSLHGAGVEGIGQADCYAPKTGLVIAAPTNRRPFGFDWEDVGRLDALEVLGAVQREQHADLARTFVTGHSMGGHGTWSLASFFPDRFAAAAPSAGWISFKSYAGGRPDKDHDGVGKLLTRAAAVSDTMLFASNLLGEAVYVLHGDADDNVPVDQARAMREWLGKQHSDFNYYERKGAGHWWGNECVDWLPIFQMFARRSLPAPNAAVDFTTVNPGVSDRCRWVRVLQQERALAPSRVRATFDAGKRAASVATENAVKISIDAAQLGEGARPAIEIDGAAVAVPEGAAGELRFARRAGAWSFEASAAPAEKRPERSGPFKLVMQRRFLLAYGTGGTPEESAWARSKARYDAETFWVRGNGSPDCVSDAEFLSSGRGAGRNVILYGNHDTNRAWDAVIGAGPVDVRAGKIIIGSKEISGRDAGVLFVRPRADEPNGDTLAAVLGGNSIIGMRTASRVPYVVSGIHLPDCVAVGADAVAKGEDGVICAGFFGNDWGVESGEFEWR